MISGQRMVDGHATRNAGLILLHRFLARPPPYGRESRSQKYRTRAFSQAAELGCLDLPV